VSAGAPDDRSLLTAHVHGDPDAFAELVRRHRDRLWAVALRTLGDPEEAADALQDALISALRGAAGYRGDAAVTTWLHRIVVNACLDRMRRRRSRPTVPLGDHEVLEPSDPAGVREARLDLRRALARLPEGQRMAVVLVDLEDLSVSETAQLLGVAEGTVKSRCALLRAGDPDPDARAANPDARAANPDGVARNPDGRADVGSQRSGPARGMGGGP
jgi:RNA polymerase sigma-70 factor (ECF subfamily)